MTASYADSATSPRKYISAVRNSCDLIVTSGALLNG